MASDREARIVKHHQNGFVLEAFVAFVRQLVRELYYIVLQKQN